MKVIRASTEILPEAPSRMQEIEQSGRICYKSEDKITNDSAEAFVGGIIKRKHNSVLEMAKISLTITPDPALVTTRRVTEWLRSQSRYLSVDAVDTIQPTVLATGTVRAWREFLKYVNLGDRVVKAIAWVLNQVELKMFSPSTPTALTLDSVVGIVGGIVGDGWIRENVPQEEIQAKHLYAKVKFIVNRAVSHELVRHRPVGILQESQRYCCYADDRFGNEVTFIEPSAFWEEGAEERDIWENACQQAEVAYFNLLGKGASPQAARTVLPNSCKTEVVVFANLREWNHILCLRSASTAEPSMREVMIPLHEKMKAKFPGFFEKLVQLERPV